MERGWEADLDEDLACEPAQAQPARKFRKAFGR